MKPEDIQAKILQFYTSLLGSCATQLPMIDVPIMRSGPKLSYEDKVILCQPITNVEIDVALKGIHDCKASGTDGLNVVFFKKTWPMSKHDMYKRGFCPEETSQASQLHFSDFCP